MSEDEGLKVLSEGLKDFAQNEVSENKRDYYQQNVEGFGLDLYRLENSENLNSYLGFHYERNDTAYKHIIDYNLVKYETETGYEIIGRNKGLFTLEPGQDDIILLRRTSDTAKWPTFSTNKILTAMNDGVMIEKTKKKEAEPINGSEHLSQ